MGDVSKYDRVVTINIADVRIWLYLNKWAKVTPFETDPVNWFGLKIPTYIINNRALSGDEGKEAKSEELEGFEMNLRDLKDKAKGEKIMVIANPPYSIAGPITKAVLDILKPDEYVSLMPANDYKCGKKKDRLYRHIKTIEAIPAGMFEDATVSPHLALLSFEKVNKWTDDEFEVMCYNPKYKKFYDKNIKRKITWKKELLPASLGKDTKEECEEGLRILNNKTDFLITARTVLDGTHKTPDCHDYRWNVEKSTTYKDLIISYNKASNKYYPNVGFIYFNNETEFNNFSDYWYRGNLSNKLIKGLNKTGGSWSNAIPRIDWNRPWTDEEILKEYGYDDKEIEEILSAPDPRKKSK
jgi:hypothetical protein